MDRLASHFPSGDKVLRTALRREGVRPDQVDARLLYTGVSWSVHVTCPEASYKRVVHLAPDLGMSGRAPGGGTEHQPGLRADMAWSELCESIAEEVARAMVRQEVARARGETT